jgi:hypothetical protein
MYMKRLLAIAGMWVTFFAAVAAAEDKRVTYVDLKDKFTHKLSGKGTSLRSKRVNSSSAT